MMRCFPSLVIHPTRLGGRDVFALPPLGAAGEQDDERLTVLSKVNSIAGPKSNFSSATPPPSPFTWERLPRDSRVSATAILAWVCLSSESSQA
jgi:hypothetical protein